MNTRIGGWIASLLVSWLAIGSIAQADLHQYAFIMDGPSERPANASPGTGTGLAIYDDSAGTLTLSAAFSGLTGTVTQTHFHGVTATSGLPDSPGETLAQAANAVLNVGIAVGAPSLPGFPTGGTSGVYAQVLNLDSSLIYNATFLGNAGSVANARAIFVQSLADATTYWNIHSTTFPGGEIRGFPVLIPEPGSIGLAAVGIGAVALKRRRRRG